MNNGLTELKHSGQVLPGEIGILVVFPFRLQLTELSVFQEIWRQKDVRAGK